MSAGKTKRFRQPVVVIATLLVVLNILAWGLLAGLSQTDATLLGIGALAFGFGLRHAFDADHIAAIDNVTRKLRQTGQRPLGVGLFFSLGHSTVVCVLSACLVLAIRSTQAHMPQLEHWGNIIGPLISAAFLTLIGLINLAAFSRLWRAFQAHRRWGQPVPGDAELESLLQRRGLFSRILHNLYRHINRSWKMYPIGLLFGLGFDTASEIAILGLSAAAAQNGHLPLWGVMVFPLLFTAAMSLMDTLDGIVMLRAYDWAFNDAARKLYFNTTLTGLSVLLALSVGLIEWLQLFAPALGIHTGLINMLDNLNFSQIGIGVTLTMLACWGLALAYYRHTLNPYTHD